MYIGQLFEKDIERRINAAVVVSELDDNSVQQEIEEYIFTPDIINNVYKFLNAVTNTKKSKTGIWISGYYGSGKSHFIKYLFYCLNTNYRTKAIARYLEKIKDLDVDTIPEVTLSEASLMTKKMDKFEVDEIIFNIDVVSGEKNKDAITNVLINQFNKFRGYNDVNIPLALLVEKPLNQKGLFESFKVKFKEAFGQDWRGSEIRAIQRSLGQVIEIAQSLDNTIDVESLRNAIQNQRDYRIEDLIQEFRAYLEDKPDTYRLVFLLDEMSQYIGSNTSLLLNLQSIIEEIGTHCDSKIWIVCTAQQDLSNLIENRDNKTEDFGKILGRFETMISLQSQDAAYITKKRVLDKNVDGTAEMTKFFNKNKVAIENQFVVVHDLYKNYVNQDDFLLTYPFIPYQFQLITDVFAAFSQAKYVGEGVRDTERSILGITHFTAQLCKDEDTGYFVPFDQFFNEQLKKNLTHYANNIIARAYNIERIRKDKFAIRVVNVLFMLSSLSESKQINFPSTVENIALLLMNSLYDQKLDLQKKVQTILSVLVDKKIIQESENSYRFYKEDEIEVANLIEQTSINNEYRLERLQKDILPKIVGNFKLNYPFGNNNFKAALMIDDKQVNTKGDFKIQFLFYEQKPVEELALTVAKSDLMVCCYEWFRKDKSLMNSFQKYAKTDKFIGENGNAKGKRKDTIQNFRIEVDKTRGLLIEAFKKHFLTTRYISANQVIQADEVPREKAEDRYEAIINKHLKEVYHKNELAEKYTTNQSEFRLKAAAAIGAIKTKSLLPAEDDVENFLLASPQGVTVSDTVKYFEKAPYGWKDISTLHVLVELARKEKRQFELKNEPLELESFGIQAVNTRTRDAIVILRQKGFSPAEISNFIENINYNIFAETLVSSKITDYKTIREQFKHALEQKLKDANALKEAHGGKPYNVNFTDFYRMVFQLSQERDATKLLNLLNDNKTEYRAIRDNYVQLKEFIEDRQPLLVEYYDFVENNYNNFNRLGEVEKVQSKRLREYLKSDANPWVHFPEMKKIHKALKRAIDNKVVELQQNVVELYRAAFEDLETKRTELKVQGILPDATAFLEQLGKLKVITELQLQKERLSSFKSRMTKALYDAVPKPKTTSISTSTPKPKPTTDTQDEDKSTTETPLETPVYEQPRAIIFKVSEASDLRKEIKNEGDLNDYINSLRAKLLKELRNNKIIILE
jgi:hypothetical protein